MKKRVLSLFLALMLCLTLLPTSAYAEGRDGNLSNIGATTEENDQPTDPESQVGGNDQSNDEAGGGDQSNDEAGGGVQSSDEAGDEQTNSETDTRTEIWRDMSRSQSISRGYDGTTDGSMIKVTYPFTDGSNEILLEEGRDCEAVKTFDSADAGWHTVTVEITLTGEAANKYKLKEGEEKFEIGGNINKAYPDLTVSLSKATCTVGEKLLPLLSISGVEEDAAVTYYYTQYKTIAGDSEYEGSDAVPKIDENTVIDKLDEEGNNTYYLYAKTAATGNYNEDISNIVELTVSEKIDPVVTVIAPDGETYFDSLPAALNAAKDQSTVRLNKDVTVNAGELGEDFTKENALAVSGKSITLNLNGYVLESNAVPMTVKSGATLTVIKADAGNTENTTQIGLNLDLLVEKGGTLFCTGGRMKKLQLQDAGEGGYNLKLAGRADHCTLDAFSSENATVTVNDVLKVNHQGLALYAENAGTAVRIEKNTLISQIDPASRSFYVGTCSDHWSGKDGTCVYCGATVAAGDDCIAHATTDSYVWHFKTLQDLVNEIEGVKWIDQNYKTVPVKFLKDVTATETLKISKCSTRIILDLDGHTISGNLDVPVVDVNYTYGLANSHCIAIQNGTIENTGTGAALKLSCGATTLEDVDIKGDTVFTLLFFNSSNYTPTFLGGGSFTRICAEGEKSGWSVRIEKMLPKGCYFADLNTGTRVNQTDITSDSPLENVTVKPCSHKDADGNSTFTDKPAGKAYYYCSVCGDLCPHASRTENQDGTLHCNDCQLTLTAVKRDQKSGVTYYIKLSDAFEGNYESVIWPLCDQPCTQAALTYVKSRTIDLNGCTVTAVDSKGKLFRPYIEDHIMTLRNSAEKQGHYVCDSLLVQKDGTLVVPAGNNNLVISAVVIGENGTARLAGGSFGSIRIGENSDKKLTDLLVSGYYFADTATGKPAALYDKDGNPLTELTNVTVTKCSHDDNKIVYVPNGDGTWVWKCCCGKKTFVASVTKGETATLYTDLQEAFRAADGGTVKLMADVTEVTVNNDSPFTLDLNGRNINTLNVNSKMTIRDSATKKGRIGKVVVQNDEENGLTLGDLLEEGYAFKYENGYWADDSHVQTSDGMSVTVEEAPIRRVVLDAIGADKKKVPTTMAYGTTGAVTLEASCWINDMNVPTYTWYKLEGAAATAPMEGVNGVKYKLPADLPAGTHTYLVTCTSGGYSKSAEITITVTPVSLEGAEVTVGNLTYNGKEQSPMVTVKLNDKTTLTSGKDFTVTVTEQTDVGSYRLDVVGRNNYMGRISVPWSIKAREVTPTIEVAKGSYVYDAGRIIKPEITVRDDLGNTIDPKEYDVSFKDNTGAGTATVTVTDKKGGNYVLGTVSKTFTIKKAAGGSLGEVEWSQRYTHTKDFTYTPDWSKLPNGQNFKYSSTYSVSEGSKVKLSRQNISDDGRLTYAISDGNVNDRITITLRASCDNYEDFTITMNITLTEKEDQKALVITGNTSVVYGQILKLTITGGSGTGAVTYCIDKTASTGEAVIDKNGVLTPVRVGSVCVIAVKAGDSNYNDVISAPFVLMIRPAPPTDTPKDTGNVTGGGSSSLQDSSKDSSDGSSSGTAATPAPAGGKTPSPTPELTAAPVSTPISAPVSQPASVPSKNGRNNREAKEPFIKGEEGMEGWQVIESQTDGAKEGETIHVDMNGATTVPGTIFDSIRGRDITVTFDLGGGILWTVNGLDITAQNVKNIDLGVMMGEQAGRNIPVEVINNVTGERYSMNLTLVYEGEFGFTATLTVNMDAANAGLYANLFYYNPETGELEFMYAGKIDEAGNTELTFSHASDYTIVIDTIPMDGSVQDKTGAETGMEQDGTLDDPNGTGAVPSGQTVDQAVDGNSGNGFNNGILRLLIGAAAVVVIAAIGAGYVLRRRKEDQQEDDEK